jgi:GNAT superfamily N-acetyltransferase
MSDAGPGDRSDGGRGAARTDEQVVESLISRRDPADAVAAYYAWWHAGTRIHVRRKGKDVGVVLEASSEYGPVAVLRASDPSIVPPLLDSLPSGRRYLMAPWALADAARRAARFEEIERNRVFRLDRRDLGTAAAVNASLRYEDAAVVAVVDDEVAASCRILWRSSAFAELAVATKPEFRRRGLARAVLAALSFELLEENVTPLHVATVTNTVSIRLAESAGFTRCAGDEFAGYLIRESLEGGPTSEGAR